MPKKRNKQMKQSVEGDGRPDNVYPKCGYGTCCYKLQTPFAKKLAESKIKVIPALAGNGELLNS